MSLFKLNKNMLNKQNTSEIVKKLTKNSNMLQFIEELKDNVKTLDYPHKVVTEEEDLIDFLKGAEYVAIDTETTGLDPVFDDLVGLSLYVKGKDPIYVPVNHVDFITLDRINNQADVSMLKRVFNLFKDIKYILHNIVFDARFLNKAFGIKFKFYWDTSIGAKLLNENEEEFSLKYLHTRYVSKEKNSKFKDLFKDVKFDRIPIHLGAPYASYDAQMTYELYEFQTKYLNKDMLAKQMNEMYELFQEIELPVAEVVYAMEQMGVPADKEVLDRLNDKYSKISEEAYDNCVRLMSKYRLLIEQYNDKVGKKVVEYPINVSSPVQLQVFFYDILKLPPFSKDEPRSTGKDALKKMNNELADAILVYRNAEKFLSTFITPMYEYSSVDGRIHGRFNTLGARCITKESLLLTDKGYLPIVDLFKGTEKQDDFEEIDLTIFNRYLQKEKATHKIVYYNQPTLKITTRLGYVIEGTLNHPIIATNYKWSSVKKIKSTSDFIELKDLEIGSRVAIPLNYNQFPTEYVKASFNCEPNKKGVVLPKYFDEDFAEFLGMYHADGVIEDSNGVYTIRICNQNEEVRSRVSYLIEKLFNLKASFYEDYVGATSVKLREIGNVIKRGARNKTIPDFLYQSPKSVIASYIRGMTLDSTYDKNREILTMTIADANTHLFIKSVLLNIGIVSTSSSFVGKHLYNHVNEYVEEGVKYNRLSVSGKMYEKFLKEIGCIQSKKIDIKETYKENEYKIIDNVLYVKVKSIEKKVNDVYDIHVPNTHSFIANGIINHNTGRFSSNKPNLQNIPSRNKEIRTIFCGGTTYKDYNTNEKQYIFEKCEELEMIDGTWKFVELLEVGDTTIDNQVIKSVKVEKGWLGKVEVGFF